MKADLERYTINNYRTIIGQLIRNFFVILYTGVILVKLKGLSFRIKRNVL